MTELTRYLSFDRPAWAALRASTPLTLTESDLVTLRGINERISLGEVVDIYLPLSRLLNLYVSHTQSLFHVTETFLGHQQAKVPYIIGIAGSVAVGKSTSARILQALLSRWPGHPRVDLITTDGFLHPNRVLEERGLMHRKGFPESYDVGRLLRFLMAVKAGEAEARAPIYSHTQYDIVQGEEKVVLQPDIVIVEGLNVLQTGGGQTTQRLFVSDFFDFSIYVDAPGDLIETWYVERFMTLRRTVFTDPGSYFHRYATFSDDESMAVARRIWREINGVNLRDNILPTRERAQLILEKGPDHAIHRVRLRRL
jgi:type I pantothenate kinase